VLSVVSIIWISAAYSLKNCLTESRLMVIGTK
jgi:hypothetical protein